MKVKNLNQTLMEENKKLKEEKEFFYKSAKQFREENKKLKSDLAETQKIGESWRQECKQLREDVDYRHHRAMVAERGGEDED